MDKTALNISSSSSHLQVGLICHLLPPTLPNPSPSSWCCSKKNLLVHGERDVSGGLRRRHVEWGRAPWRRDQPRGVASVAQPAHGQRVQSSPVARPAQGRDTTGSGARYPAARPAQEHIHVHAKTAYTDVHKFILLSSR
jgi:hypothetical protein